MNFQVQKSQLSVTAQVTRRTIGGVPTKPENARLAMAFPTPPTPTKPQNFLHSSLRAINPKRRTMITVIIHQPITPYPEGSKAPIFPQWFLDIQKPDSKRWPTTNPAPNSANPANSAAHGSRRINQRGSEKRCAYTR
jgi:hypothetical protein